MPIIKSAKKQMRKSLEARERNRLVKDEFRKKVKLVQKNLHSGKNIEVLASEAISAIDKTAKSGVIHKSAADRRKSRLIKAINLASKKPVELKTRQDKKEPATKKTAQAKTLATKKNKRTKKASK